MTDKILKEWAKDFSKEFLSQETRDLINMAAADLWYGPYSAQTYAEEEPERATLWPGFSKACDKIRVALREALPDPIWVDGQSGCWSDTEPLWVENLDPDHDVDACDNFDCECHIAQFSDDYYKLEFREAVALIVGQSLSEYVR